MQIVIDISDIKYQWIKDNPLTYDNKYCEAIRNGAPLPKGHGRLIDADALCDYFWDNRSRLYTHKDLRIAIDNAPTIIEADIESEDKGE